MCRWWRICRSAGRRIYREDDESVGSAYRRIKDELLHTVKFTEQHVTLAGNFRLFFRCCGKLRPEGGVLLAQASCLGCRMVVSLEFLHPFLKRRFLVLQALYYHGYALIDPRQAVCMIAELEGKRMIRV